MMFVKKNKNNKIKKNKNNKINVLITFKCLMNYLSITLCTLKDAIKRYKNVNVFLYNTNENYICPESLDGLPITFRVTKPFKSIETMYRHIISEVFKQTDSNFLFILESDSVVHPDIFFAINSMINDLPDMGYGSVFNTPFHPSLKQIGKKYLKKKNLGFFGSIIKRELWTQLKTGIDWAYSDLVKKKGLGIYCTNRSYLEHIGFSGRHHRSLPCPYIKNCIATVDRAINFLN
jgi:hypothetical protein